MYFAPSQINFRGFSLLNANLIFILNKILIISVRFCTQDKLSSYESVDS